MDNLNTIKSIQSVLTEDLLKKEYRGHSKTNPTYGHCYVAAEVLLFLLKEKGESGWRPTHAKDDVGVVHWWLQKEGEILDPTAEQYFSVGKIPPYDNGRGGGFLTKYPSKRAIEVLKRVQKDVEE